MSDGIEPRSGGLRIGRLALCCAAALGAAAASWITPPPVPQVRPAPVHRPVPAPRPRPAHAAAGHFGGGFARPGLAVAQWGFRSGNGEDVSATGSLPAGRPLVLSLTLDGGAAAVDQIRARGFIAIEVRWKRQSGESAPGAPDLVTRLRIGRPGLASALAAEVRRTGFFAWHSWAEKTSLSAGRWSVSLTYPDGTPLVCGDPPVPCRFRIAVG